MLVSYFMITYSFVFGKLKGSSYLLRAHGKGGASATILSSLSVPPSEKIAGGFQQAGKKEGVGGKEFLPARAFSFCRAKRDNQSEFRSKKVRASFSNSDRVS